MKHTLFISLFAAFVSGCAGTASVIKDVSDKTVVDLKITEESKPIQLSKVVIKLKRGDHIGANQIGLFCMNQGNITWRGGRLKVDSDEFTDTFKEELEKFNFKVVGDTNALFEDSSSWKAELLVAGLVKDLKANLCYPWAGMANFVDSKGEAFMKVEWQIYSKLDRSVVHTVTTEGSSKITEITPEGANNVVLNAFSQAARNLLADEKFREIVSKGGKSVKQNDIRVSSASILLTANKSKPIVGKPEDWSDGVVTVFAGNGHGSGFVISDDLILTNQHVVGSSNAVTLKLKGGFEIIGKVLASNSSRDVAVIKTEMKMPKRFKVNKNLPTIGEEVYAIGTPLKESFELTLSKGIVSAIRTENGKKLIQGDVNVLPGNSGGPLVNKLGEVVGITVSGIMINKSSQGLNFFIPVDEALQTLGIK